MRPLPEGGPARPSAERGGSRLPVECGGARPLAACGASRRPAERDAPRPLGERAASPLLPAGEAWRRRPERAASRAGRLGRLVRRAALAAVAGAVACSTHDEGEGEARSELLRAGRCYEGPYDLKPTFFAINPFQNTQLIRLQRTNDLTENADGVMLLVNDAARVRASLGTPLRVGLPPEVTPPGTPVVADPDPPFVHLALYLQETCHRENVTLYATEGTVTFDALFSGNLNEKDAEEKRTEGRFDVTIGDPRDAPPGGGAIPAERQSRLEGTFQFYFQRGQPAQPFP